MNTLIYLFLLILLSFLLGLLSFQAYFEIVDSILNPICPLTICSKTECPNSECICLRANCFPYECIESPCDCAYDITCVAMGHCPECPKSYKQELIETQILLENCQTLKK